MGKLFKTFLAKFFKVFGIAFVTAFCIMQLSITEFLDFSVTDVKSILLFVVWLFVVVGGAVATPTMSFFNGEFYVTPTAVTIIVGITPFIKSYLATLGIAVLWLGYELYKEEWFRHIEDYIKERKKEREKRLSEKLKKQAFIEAYGEKNIEIYDEVIKSVDEMIRFNEELYVDSDVWVKMKQFISDKPESASNMRELFDRNVILMLDVYHQLPKDEKGRISNSADCEILERSKRALGKLNNSMLKSFNDMKQMCNLDINVCLDLVEKSLMDV